MMSATLVAMLLAVPVAATPVPSLPAREQMLDLLEHKALHRDRVDWAALRRDLAVTTDPDRQRALLSDAINRATAGHGGWLSAEEMREGYRKRAAGQDEARASVPGTAPDAPVDARLGLIGIASYLPGPGLSREQQRDAERQHARRLQDDLWRQDDGSRCGWIVDLGDNTGGNMWPMLLGVGPLLRGRADGPDVVGHFFDGTALQPGATATARYGWAMRRGWPRTIRPAACAGRMRRSRYFNPGAPPVPARPSCWRCAGALTAAASVRRPWGTPPETCR